MKFISNSAKDTEKTGFEFAQELRGTEVVALFGDMGAGKTTFVRGMAEFFGIQDMVSSPTFSIMQEYDARKFTLYHFDMYRVNSEEDLESTGFFDYIDQGVLVIEWSENIKEYLPENTVKINFLKGKNENQRIIEIDEVNLK